tara:strand:- start:88 stop:432 length:345 start_codon:yes stop_codon:yes gene_type:complete
MKFEIKTITPAMSHEEKVYEYSLRVAYYSKASKLEKEKAKDFNCLDLDINNEVSGGFNGGGKTLCFQNEHKEPCKNCNVNADHYIEYLSLARKKATASRQLTVELKSKIEEYEI